MEQLVNVSERGLIRRILGRNKYVACTEAASMDAIRWANPGSSLSARELDRLYKTGFHTGNGGRTTLQILAAVRARYGHSPDRVTSLENALDKLRAGYVLTVAGNYGLLGTHFARWDLRFARGPQPASHCLCFGPLDPLTMNTDDPSGALRDPLRKSGAGQWEWAKWSMVSTDFAFGASDMLAYPHLGWVK